MERTRGNHAVEPAWPKWFMCIPLHVVLGRSRPLERARSFYRRGTQHGLIARELMTE